MRRTPWLAATLLLASCTGTQDRNETTAEVSHVSHGCALSPRDLRAHDARRGEALLGGITAVVLLGRMLSRRTSPRDSLA